MLEETHRISLYAEKIRGRAENRPRDRNVSPRPFIVPWPGCYLGNDDNFYLLPAKAIERKAKTIHIIKPRYKLDCWLSLSFTLL